MRTITAMFDSRADAETARERLAAAGISVDDVSIHDKSSLGQSSDGAVANGVDRDGGSYRRDETDLDRDGYRGVEADGREGTHRNAIGDYIDDRSGERLMKDAGSERTALGDYVDNDTGNSKIHHDGAAHQATTSHGRGLWAQIKSFFTGDDDIYEEGLRRGGYLVTARVADQDAERAIDILDDDGAVDLGAREASWRSEGWASGNTSVDRGSRGRIGSYASDDYTR